MIPTGRTPELQKYDLVDAYYSYRWTYDFIIKECDHPRVKSRFDGTYMPITWRIAVIARCHKWDHKNNGIEQLQCEQITKSIVQKAKV